MKKHLLLFFSVTVFSCFSQDMTLGYKYVTNRSELGYFLVWNSTDTSIVAGRHRIENDTVYFEAILDTLIIPSGSHQVNTSGGNYSSVVRPNSIALTFHYLDKFAPLMYMPHFSYQFIGDSIYSSKCKKPLELDTVHYIPYIPGAYDSLVFDYNNDKFSYQFTSLVSCGSGRKKRKLEQIVKSMDFIQCDFVVYSSVENFEFNLIKMLKGYVFLNGIKYPIVIGE